MRRSRRTGTTPALTVAARTGVVRTGTASTVAVRTSPPLAVVALTVATLAVTACGGPATPVPSSPPPAPTPSAPTPSTNGVPSATGNGRSASASPTGTPNAQRVAAGFVVLTDEVPTIVSDIRYAGPHNFVGRRVAGYEQPLCLVTRQAADALRRVQAAALAFGRSLKVYDCYRPERAGRDFVTWAGRPDEQRTKAEFYPTLTKRQLFSEGYVAGGRDGHSRGSTVDLTLVDVPTPTQRPYVPGEPLVACTAPRGQRFPDNSVDMGTGFDCFDTLAHTDAAGVSEQARTNRRMLRELMTGAGFVNYPKEWWHYQLAGEPYPDTYFDFPVAR